ncbi:MAG: hypothetical protein JST79_20470 [Acidobacteria bacterium]|nr:hypothetical protein [Acidobacteriota bacterium]
MQETYEIRLFAKHLPLLGDTTGNSVKLGRVAATIRGTVHDPLFVRIGELEQHLRSTRQGVAFAAWRVERHYSKEEVAAAELFLLNVPFTEVSGEEYGTQYEDLLNCEQEIEQLEYTGGADFRIHRKSIPCSLNTKQIGPLRIAFSKLRRKLDVYRLWGGELIVSEGFVCLNKNERISGGAFFPIVDVRNDNLTLPLQFSDSATGLEILSIAADKHISPGDWKFWEWLNDEEQQPLLAKMLAPQKRAIRDSEKSGSVRNLAQLTLRSNPLQISKQSQFGETPFDTENKDFHRCDGGIIAGRRLISPLSVLRSSWDGSDLCRTEVYVGGQRQGLFRPYQLLVVSKRLFQAMLKHKMKGFHFEIVELI